MSGEAHMPPPPPPPPGGAGYHPHHMNGEWLQYSRGPNGHHYYTYVNKYRRCWGRWGSGFVVGGLVGIFAASYWQRRHCHDQSVGACWSYRGPWEMNKKSEQIDKKSEDVTNQ